MNPVPVARVAAARRLACVVLLVVAATASGACARYKKLSAGGSMPEVVIHDVFGQDRSPRYYYELVRDSHDEATFHYTSGSDTYLVDKNIDAIHRLGNASFGRLEGQAQVVELFIEVLIEDRSALARSAAANSLTKLGLKLPTYPGTPVDDRGDLLLQYARGIDAAYGPNGTGRPSTPAERDRVRSLLERVGNLRFPYIDTAKDALKLFFGRSFLVDESDPVLREAIDTALTKRMAAVIRKGLEAAVEDPDSTVRADAVRGLKTLADATALDAVLGRLDFETDWLVRLEIAEYLGRIGSRDGVIALVDLLDEPNASVRHKARRALTRIAGADHGFRASAWKHWARGVDPSIDFGDADPDDDDAADDEGDDPGAAPLR